MEPFVRLQAIAAPLLTANVNTDVLIRVEPMIAVPRGQLGPYCFEVWRYGAERVENPDFILNQAGYRGAKILLAGVNFGCGSSREPAVWALQDMGFRCVIAASFGDIFFNNCFQSGLLPIVLPEATITGLAEKAKPVDGRAPEFTVDLEGQVIIAPDGEAIPFKIDALKRRALLEGLDDVGVTLAIEDRITRFQNDDRARRPWIYRY
jgi:3-isopropylmalate/(R)-2-methylmalate dehydratase small subunit